MANKLVKVEEKMTSGTDQLGHWKLGGLGLLPALLSCFDIVYTHHLVRSLRHQLSLCWNEILVTHFAVTLYKPNLVSYNA